MKIIKFVLLSLVFAGTGMAVDIEIKAETYDGMMEDCKTQHKGKELEMCKDMVEIGTTCISTVSNISLEEAKNHKNLKELANDPAKKQSLVQCYLIKVMEYLEWRKK